MIIRSITLLIGVAAFAGCTVPAGNSPANRAETNLNSGRSPVTSPTPTSTPPADNNAPAPTPTLSPLPPDPKGVQAAIDVVHEYYDAINARDYRKAYELWSGRGEASKQTFDEFRDGYANTVSVDIDTSGEPGTPEGAAGSQYIGIPLLINAKMKDGSVEKYWGEYTMRRSMVDGATEELRQWRIYSAQFRRL